METSSSSPRSGYLGFFPLPSNHDWETWPGIRPYTSSSESYAVSAYAEVAQEVSRRFQHSEHLPSLPSTLDSSSSASCPSLSSGDFSSPTDAPFAFVEKEPCSPPRPAPSRAHLFPTTPSSSTSSSGPAFEDLSSSPLDVKPLVAIKRESPPPSAPASRPSTSCTSSPTTSTSTSHPVLSRRDRRASGVYFRSSAPTPVWRAWVEARRGGVKEVVKTESGDGGEGVWVDKAANEVEQLARDRWRVEHAEEIREQEERERRANEEWKRKQEEREREALAEHKRRQERRTAEVGGEQAKVYWDSVTRVHGRPLSDLVEDKLDDRLQPNHPHPVPAHLKSAFIDGFYARLRDLINPQPATKTKST